MPQNNKTTVENKVYNLPSDVNKLMTPRTFSLHTQKNNNLRKGDISKWKTLIVLRPEIISP